MDIFQNEFHIFEDYKGKGYKKGAKVKGAGTLPGDVDVTKGLYMPKPIKVHTKAAAKVSLPGDVNVMKVAYKGMPKFNTKNVNKGNNSKSVSMSKLPNSKKSNTASFGNKGPHNNTFSNQAVRDHQEHGGMTLWEAKKQEAKKTKMKKEKPNDPISKTTVKAPWTKMTVPGDVAIGVKNQGKEYTAHTGPDYEKNSDYGKQRKVSYGSEVKNFYDHLERGSFKIIEAKKKDNNWIQGAEKDIERRGTEGKCTPITKPGCTGKAKALAKTFKKMAKKRDASIVSKKERKNR